MKIHLDFKGMPILYKALNKQKEFTLDLAPTRCTLGELVEFLTRKFGAMVRKALLDQKGDVDMEIRVVVNRDTYLAENRMQTLLEDGDSVAFLGAA